MIGQLLLLGIGYAAICAYKKSRIMKVFISYDHSEDLALRNLLEAWNKNSKFDFNFHRTSPFQPINSDNETVVKRALTPKLKKADYLLVIIGRETEHSRFVLWEIERAMAPDVNLKIAAVKRHPHCRLPSILRQGRSSWSPKFSVEGVISALESAKRMH